MYTKSWSAFDRLVAIVPPGGSIGCVPSPFLYFLTDTLIPISLDDKLFSFWLLQGDSFPFSHVKGIFRFETGIKVNEFRDLRANPRCLLESQILSLRVRWSRMVATGVLGVGSNRNRGQIHAPSPNLPGRSSSTMSSLGLPFDPYDYLPLPSRILATGAATNFPSVANLVGDAFNAPVFVPSTQVDSAQVSPHRNAPATGFPGRAALGGAYVARWVWGRERTRTASPSGQRVFGFEEEIRRLLGKRWVATGGTPLRSNVNGDVSVVPRAGGNTGSGANSGASTPYGPRSGLGSTVFVEEDEDEVEEMERLDRERSANGSGKSAYGFGEIGGHRARTQTESTENTAGTGNNSLGISSMFTTPDPSSSPDPSGGVPSTPTAAAPLTPVVAMPTADAEAQLGLAKVAEPDVDAFMTYAAIVPEYCRLESMLVKSLV